MCIPLIGNTIFRRMGGGGTNWDNLIARDAQLEYMEFTTDSLIQTAYLTNDTGKAAWTSKATKSGAEVQILSLVAYNGKVYGGSLTNGQLLEWNGSNAWVVVAAKSGSCTGIRSLCVFNNKIYGGSYDTGELLEWNGTNAWVVKAAISGSETQIDSLCVFNNKLYGGSLPNANLLEWNGINAWVSKATKLSTETSIRSLVVFNNKLYGSTNNIGRLYEWNGVDAWVLKASISGTQGEVYSLVVLNNEIYGGTYALGKLLKWNGVDAWVVVAEQSASESQSHNLAIINNKIYAGTYPNGQLLEWNGTNAWALKCAKLGSETQIQSMITFNGNIYAGTNANGLLYEWGYNLLAQSESTLIAQGSYSLKAIAAITGSLNKTLTKTFVANINLSGCNTITFSMRASRTGSNIKIGLHDTGGTVSEITPNITSANAWQTVTWDLSGVAAANKDNINSIIVTVVNADAENIFYIDNLVFNISAFNDTVSLFKMASHANSSLTAMRTTIKNLIWPGGYPSTGKDHITTGVASPLASDSANLASVDQLTFHITGIADRTPYVWHPTTSNGKFVIWHLDHFGAETGTDIWELWGRATTIRALITAGYTVCGILMPPSNAGLEGYTHSFPVASAPYETVDDLHFFLDTAIRVLNEYAGQFTKYYIAGMSGGGWSTVMMAAIDTRITKSAPIAGSLPRKSMIAASIDHDWEQQLSDLYNLVDYSDLYVLGCSGGREQTQYLNYTEPAFSAAVYNYYPYAEQVSYLTNGRYNIFWSVSATHIVTAEATAAIVAFFNS